MTLVILALQLNPWKMIDAPLGSFICGAEWRASADRYLKVQIALDEGHSRLTTCTAPQPYSNVKHLLSRIVRKPVHRVSNRDIALAFIANHPLALLALTMDQVMDGGRLPLEAWFWEMPACTRWWTAATVLTSALVQCHMVTPFQLFYSFRAVFVKSQVRDSLAIRRWTCCFTTFALDRPADLAVFFHSTGGC